MTPEAVAQGLRMLSDHPLANIELRKSMEVLRKEYDFTENDVILYSESGLVDCRQLRHVLISVKQIYPSEPLGRT